MLRTFNCGIGLVLVSAKDQSETVAARLRAAGEEPAVIGEIEQGRGVKSAAKGKGEAEAVRYSGALRLRVDQEARRDPHFRPRLQHDGAGRGGAPAEFPAEIVAVISNRPDAAGLAWAKLRRSKR